MDTMNHGDTMGGDDMGMGMGGSTCKLNMLWNWDTIDSCFLAESWHVKNEGMMAVTCIGIFLLAMALEFVRRVGKQYDRFILQQFHQQVNSTEAISDTDKNGCAEGQQACNQTATFRATPVQQLIRSVIHAVAFGTAYLLMLIAMSYNGYVIFMIILGAGFGKFVSDWMSHKVAVRGNMTASEDDVKSSEEPTMCCG